MEHKEGGQDKALYQYNKMKKEARASATQNEDDRGALHDWTHHQSDEALWCVAAGAIAPVQPAAFPCANMVLKCRHPDGVK